MLDKPISKNIKPESRVGNDVKDKEHPEVRGGHDGILDDKLLQGFTVTAGTAQNLSELSADHGFPFFFFYNWKQGELCPIQ